MKYLKLNGAAVAALREEAGISQAELARQCGISAAHLSKLENGLSQPSAPIASRLALRLRVGVTDITQPAEAAS
jgi:transcriptional regulator with XRE-family HTH domain